MRLALARGGRRRDREERAPGDEAPPAFEVLDALGGAISLIRRSPTLEGSVPLRVAQACVPLLEGNAFGFQLVLRDRFEAERSLGRWRVRGSAEAEALTRTARAVLPILALRGLLTGAACARLGAMWPSDVRPRRALSIWTGLLARPHAGVRLRVSSTANRRSRSYLVREALLEDGGALHPIVLDLAPTERTLSLGGEVATLAPLPGAPLPLERVPLEEAGDIVEAHLRFYDRAYFEQKRRGEVARAYQDLIRRRRAPGGRAAASGNDDGEGRARDRVELVDAGPSSIAPGGARGEAPDRLVFRNAVPFAARFDGQRVATNPDPRAMRGFAERVRAAWGAVRERSGDRMHEGAMLYFSKYFTPHPAGEPHFFVKPSSLLRTPAGTSLLIEGQVGAGYDVLRGVVHADVFHAAPAVFQLWSTGQTIEVAEGTPLAELFPVPRELMRAGFSRREAELAP